MIDRAHVGAVIDSAYGYLSSVDNFYVGRFADDSEFELDGSYVIESGKLGDYDIAFSGNVPIAGRLTYRNNDFVNGIIQYDDYYVLMYGDMLKVIGVPKNNSDGLYASSLEMDKGRYLYRGKDPSNYLILKEKGVDTLYRIISYENDGTVKVIRDDSIGAFAWDSDITIIKVPWRNTSLEMENQISKRWNSNTYCQYGSNYYGCNVWGMQNNTYYQGKTLNELYNSFHYKWYLSDDITTLNPISPDLTKTVNEESTLNILLNREWLPESGLSEYIDNHEFDVGGLNPSSKSLVTEKMEQSNYRWIGKVGLMYITDMVESSTNPACISVYENFCSNPANSVLQSSGAWPCKNTVEGTEYGNWLHKNSYIEWSLSAYSSSRFVVLAVSNIGFFHGYYARDSRSVRPVFFLKSSLKLNGEGTIDKPFRFVEY